MKWKIFYAFQTVKVKILSVIAASFILISLGIISLSFYSSNPKITKQPFIEAIPIDSVLSFNWIDKETMFLFYVKNSGINDLSQQKELVKEYCTYLKGISLKNLDEFDLKRLIKRYADTISNKVNLLDYKKIYTSQIIDNWGIYDFNSKSIPIYFGFDLAQGNPWGMTGVENTSEVSLSTRGLALRLLHLNVKDKTYGFKIPMGENEAEKIKKVLNNQTRIAIIKYLKFLPASLSGRRYDWQFVKLIKLSFHYLITTDQFNNFKLGEKFYEMDWPSKSQSHLVE